MMRASLRSLERDHAIRWLHVEQLAEHVSAGPDAVHAGPDIAADGWPPVGAGGQNGGGSSAGDPCPAMIGVSRRSSGRPRPGGRVLRVTPLGVVTSSPPSGLIR
ncbi:hypothetical protein SAMN05661080_02606 [Modestobacter sp. DSM 44400]|nr:hypothetical protein SAMN05661080_02606 [Modestobacter sp. DSM 44400]